MYTAMKFYWMKVRGEVFKGDNVNGYNTLPWDAWFPADFMISLTQIDPIPLAKHLSAPLIYLN